MEIVTKNHKTDRFEVDLFQGAGFVRVQINGRPVVEFLASVDGEHFDKPCVYMCSEAKGVISKIYNRHHFAVGD